MIIIFSSINETLIEAHIAHSPVGSIQLALDSKYAAPVTQLKMATSIPYRGSLSCSCMNKEVADSASSFTPPALFTLYIILNEGSVDFKHIPNQLTHIQLT